MGIFDRLKKSDGGYIFLSHSHDDIENVRRIRNALEKKGFEPLCFYLKCLSDDSEIEDLIKREIDAREWFIFANSENSRKSKWVTLEREYIARTDSKKILTVDINNDEEVEELLYKILHNLRVFISYSENDGSLLAKRLADELERNDYLVFQDEMNITVGSACAEVIVNVISEASKEGAVIALLTEKALSSSFVKNEIKLALNEGGNIFPVIVGDIELPIDMKMLLAPYPHYKLSQNATDAEISKLVDEISDYILRK